MVVKAPILFLRYALPCCDKLLAQGLLQKSEFEMLKQIAKTNNYQGLTEKEFSQLLRELFPKAVKNLTLTAKSIDKPLWSLQAVTHHWRIDHNKILLQEAISNEKQSVESFQTELCKVKTGIVSKVQNNKLLIKFPSMDLSTKTLNKDQALTHYRLVFNHWLNVSKNQLVTTHYFQAVENISRTIFFFGSKTIGDDLAWRVADFIKKHLHERIVKTSNAFEIFEAINSFGAIALNIDKDVNLSSFSSIPELVIVDVAEGFDKPQLLSINDLKQLSINSLHDFDVSYALKLLKALDFNVIVKIIALPMVKDEQSLKPKALRNISKQMLKLL